MANGKKQANMLSRVQTMISARVPVIWFLTSEEQRAEAGIAHLAANMEYGDHKGMCAIWSLTGGTQLKKVDGESPTMKPNNNPGWCEPDGWRAAPYNGTPLPEDWAKAEDNAEAVNQSPYKSLLQARDWARKHETQPIVIIVRDAHVFMKSEHWRRTVKDLSRQLRSTLCSLVLLSINEEIHPDLRRDVAIVRPGLPSVEVLTANAKKTLAKLGSKVDPRACAMALKGLGVKQANDLITLDYVENKEVLSDGTIIDHLDPERLSRLKAEELASVHGVHFEGESHQLGSVGGLDHYKAWLHKRLHALTPEAREAGIDEPKGCVFVGVPGGGKTLTARATAGKLKLPLIVLNLSECEGGIVGETATRMAEALRTVDALAPCVVLIDEIEKALGSGGEHDGGSKRTLVRLLLIWLQERSSQVFTCITSNDISGLPPELTRKGRVDEIWFVDLPNLKDREAILKIHLERRKRTLAAGSVQTISESLKGYTGSEIEEAVKEGILSAWARKCDGGDGNLTGQDVLAAAQEIVPMSLTYAAKLDAIREWAKGRARRASDSEEEPAPVATKPPKAPKPEAAPGPGTNLFRDPLKEAW